MQTVNFNCPHCGNLMAVGMNLLGRNVRCPHCKAVVQAPTAPGQPMSTPVVITPTVKPPEQSPPVQSITSAPTLPQFNLPPKESEPVESIFGQVHDEDVFGSEKPKPFIPTEPINGNAKPEPVTIPSLVPPKPMPPQEPTTDFQNPLADFDPTAGTELMPLPEVEPTAEYDNADQTPTRDLKPSPKQRQTKRPAGLEEGKGSSAFAVILLAYGLLMTIAAGVFGYMCFAKSPEPQHPFHAIPDVFGEYEKANRKQTSLKWLPDSRAEVPAGLRVKLGDELVVGDLSVTPLEVKTELITAVEKFNVGEDRVRPVGPKTLVLSLKVRNLSKDVTFNPTDPAFLRKSETKPEDPRAPFTHLVIKNERFFGVFPWPSTGNTRKEFIQGHESNEKPLKPGEESTIFVTVAPRQDVLATLRLEKGNVQPDETLLWKVQLRRGMVMYKDDSGREGEISATAVIGVSFKKSQIQ